MRLTHNVFLVAFDTITNRQGVFFALLTVAKSSVHFQIIYDTFEFVLTNAETITHTKHNSMCSYLTHLLIREMQSSMPCGIAHKMCAS